MDQRHRVQDALEALTTAVIALGEALRDAGITGEEASNGSEPTNAAHPTDGVPFVPILIPMDVLRAWGAQATPAVAAGTPAPADEVATDASPPPAARGLNPSPAQDASAADAPKRGTWVWTWEHPTTEGERIEDEIEGGR